ncbi:MAG: hypothetical protein SFV51_06270 [Bryobacteraceae bacterium]|nr:hypothetical protein [Bryobacteraceae bacterium]
MPTTARLQPDASAHFVRTGRRAAAPLAQIAAARQSKFLVKRLDSPGFTVHAGVGARTVTARK